MRNTSAYKFKIRLFSSMNMTKEIFLAVSKFLIATGSNGAGDNITKAEMVDLSLSANYHDCPDWITNYPINVKGATGGLVGRNPIICGGTGNGLHALTNQCYVITPNNIIPGAKMMNKRYAAASVVVEASLWITGGIGWVFEKLR